MDMLKWRDVYKKRIVETLMNFAETGKWIEEPIVDDDTRTRPLWSKDELKFNEQKSQQQANPDPAPANQMRE